MRVQEVHFAQCQEELFRKSSKSETSRPVKDLALSATAGVEADQQILSHEGFLQWAGRWRRLGPLNSDSI